VLHVQLDTEAVTNLAAAKGIDSVSELARRCELSQPYLARILAGERPARPSHVLKLAPVLGVKPSELLKDHESELATTMDAELAAATEVQA
jgi:transcriptional regulator with XRE-family HTH domain